MAPALDDLLRDGRLARLFSKDARHCALQLWILQIKSDQVIENRVVYGRMLPYSHSSDRWSSSEDDNFQTFGQVQAQVIRLNLYVKSLHCEELLRQLSAGRTILAISEDLRFEFSHQLKARFGATALSADDLVYRPVSYLLNRDAYARHSLSSPHGGAGAFSASITQTEKGALFRLGQDYDVALTRSVVKHLNADTGLDFGGVDAARFGDLELLVFSALDDQERPLLSANWADVPRALVARFNSMQVPHFNSFQFRLCITNDGQIIYSAIAQAKPDAEKVFECKFELGEQLHGIADSTELEIFGFNGDSSREGMLCCRWRIGYVREIGLQGHVMGHRTSSVKFDWLERTARPSASERVKKALTINRGDLGFSNHIGGRKADPWVPANRDLISLFARLHPPKSEGRFFMRWGQGDGSGRVQFVEWLKTLLAKYQQHQVAIFDPYFDAIGLGLVLLCATQNSDYVVFRSLPKPVKEGKPLRRKSDKAAQEGVNNLLANCEQSRHLLSRVKLRIYGLKEGGLHDRYILIMGPDRLPVAGFNLSNSLQTAAENFPLLITPIPADVLLDVEPYMSGLMKDASQIQTTQVEGRATNPSMQLLFDTTASPKAPRRYEPLRFLEMVQAGDVLSLWTGETSLQRLSGDLLRERMASLDLLKENSLSLPESTSLLHFLKQQKGNFEDFKVTWEILGEVLAHSHTSDDGFREIEAELDFLRFLARFLDESFSRPHDDAEKELAVMDARFFRESIDTLLHSPYHPHHFFHATKYSALTWPEYFSIKFLWRYSPGALLKITEAHLAGVPIEPQGSDSVRLSLLSQISSEIALSVQLNISEWQINLLTRSSSGLLQWMGLNAIEMQLEETEGPAKVLQLVASFSHPERVHALGWMVHHASRNPNNTETYKYLVAALHETLPEAIPATELQLLVDSMRGHMRQLAWAEPWLFKDVVFPLLQNDRANIDDACSIWMLELANMLEPQMKAPPRLFDREREGQTTNAAAFLLAHSSPERRQASLTLLRQTLKRQKRIAQQPLASTSNWTLWDGALTVSMWILAFAKWGQYYLCERYITDADLDQLAQDAGELAQLRPMDEWRSEGAGKRGELSGFLDQAEELLNQKIVSDD